MKWSFVDGCGFAFGTVAIVSPLEMMQNRVGCSAALRFCVEAVALILTVDFRGSISEVYCRRRPQ